MSYWLALLCLVLLVILPFVLPAAGSALLSAEPYAWTQRQRRVLLVLALALAISAGWLYRQLGGAQDVLIQRELQAMPTDVLYTEAASWQALAERIAMRLQQRPGNAGYLRILAEEASAREQWHQAAAYYQRLAGISGHDPAVEVLALTARFMAAGRRIDASLKADMEAVLSIDPSQASVRGMLGMAAFETGHWQEAITQWQQALQYLPADDPVAVMLAQGIVRARGQLGESLPELRVWLPRPQAIEAPAAATVFVFLSREGVPMPLAARRLSLAELPLELALGAADALGSQDWPVTEGRLQVGARLVPAGAVGGETLWEARSGWFDARAWPDRLELQPVMAAGTGKHPEIPANSLKDVVPGEQNR